MSAYVYRFIDMNGECLYVGYTGQTMADRMGQHFSDKGHLPKECYNSVYKIECKKYPTQADAILMETYYINKFKPRFNKQDKKKDTLNVEFTDNTEWELYQTFEKKDVSKPKKKSKLFKYFARTVIGLAIVSWTFILAVMFL